MKVAVFTIVPSPYQRDLFRALAVLPDVELQVYYAEAASPDSPWPKEPLQPYERILRGFWLGSVSRRFIFNWELPDVRGADVIILNGYITAPAQRLLRRRRPPQPMVFWAERMVGQRGGWRQRVHALLAQPLQRVSGVMAIGAAAAEDYRQRWPGKPVIEIPYYCDLEPFARDRPARPRDPVRVLFCGQMIARKGVDLLLQATEALVRKDLSFRLLLVGREAELPGMLAAVSSGARERIEYLGFRAPADLPAVFAEADIFVLPSRYDGWGVVVNQAIGAGLPVICSDAVGAARSLVRPGQNGTIFPCGDVEQLTRALEDLIRHPGKLAQFAETSLSFAAELQPAAGAAKIHGFLLDVLKGK